MEEFAASIFEAADHGLIYGTVIAGGPIVAPLMRCGIVETKSQTDVAGLSRLPRTPQDWRDNSRPFEQQPYLRTPPMCSSQLKGAGGGTDEFSRCQWRNHNHVAHRSPRGVERLFATSLDSAVPLSVVAQHINRKNRIHLSWLIIASLCRIFRLNFWR
jgi:hypothetical protein